MKSCQTKAPSLNESRTRPCRISAPARSRAQALPHPRCGSAIPLSRPCRTPQSAFRPSGLSARPLNNSARYGDRLWSGRIGTGQQNVRSARHGRPRHGDLLWLPRGGRRREAVAGQRRVPPRRQPLRPDERPDVGRPAPAVEGRPGGLAEPAEAAGLVGARRGRRDRRRGAAHRRGLAPPGLGHRARHQRLHAGGRPRARRSPRARREDRLRGGQCRGPAVCRRALRRLHDRLRNPQRAAYRGGARRGVPRAEAGRALPLPGVLGGRHAAARPALRGVVVQRRSPVSANGWRATTSPIPIWSSSIRKFPNQENFAAMLRKAGFERVGYRNLSGGIAALHSGWKL